MTRARRRRRALGRFDARRGVTILCGMDEVGRGCLAGPVVAAAVILEPGARLSGLDDSKRLPPEERVRLAGAVRAQARAVAIGSITPGDVDRYNIRQATFAAMRQALAGLGIRPELALVDGDPVPDLPVPQEPIVGADRRSLAVAAASVVAKVWRDELMIDYERVYPGYGFARHKGYTTSDHLEALVRLGPCPLHRRSFAPVLRAAQGSLF